VLSLSDGISARPFPFVNVALIAANFIVFIFYELPHLDASVFHASFYPCALAGTGHAPEPWEISWFTAMFCTRAGVTSSATCCSSRSSARTSRMRSGTRDTSACTSSAGSSQP
jgi:hypothetical protein